jgi:two-component system response regulator GlrR
MVRSGKILVCDLDPVRGVGNLLRRILESQSHALLQIREDVMGSSDSGKEHLLSVIWNFHPDMVFFVLARVLRKTKELLEAATKARPAPPVIAVVDEEDEPEDILQVFRAGAVDFVTVPLKAAEILPRVWQLLGDTPCEDGQRLKEELGLTHFVGTSPALLMEMRKIPLVSKCNAGTLILGETGTGKELFARAIHDLSPRADRPFVPVNCGAIPIELAENELFGHERGAYTGASRARFGMIRDADGGTLFLDEISSLPLLVQAKLLRFLDEKEYRPLGSTKTCKANVRVIAAANRPLEKAVKAGTFREDLYYRLNIIPFTLPALRDRREDILVLARHFMAKYGSSYDRHVIELRPDAVKKLLHYEWPGNVRELEHTIERAVLLSHQKLICEKDILLPKDDDSGYPHTFQKAKAEAIARFEKTYIEGLLIAYSGNISNAARAAQKNRRAFWELIRKHQIDVQPFRSTKAYTPR